ncbi:zinc finger protein 91-like [Kryptolebias marmoratus]|uniref:zinc finger protein 91-like n=1 Tax=Kryptolebias marmoratus TaxID=37003 RepID=UPI0007F91F0D|nr:zinc finger protein 91-like [Kryptolebias marmoratus]
MCEVTGEMDLEETEDDITLEPLPEPLLIILSPPPPFLPYPGEPTMLWLKWLKAFEHYIQALGEKELADSTKLVLLQNSLGSEGEHVFSTLIKNETTYTAAISALTSHFRLDYASQVHRLKFHQRVQMPGETADQFVSALEELLRPCNCGSRKEKLLLNQLIEKTNNLQLRQTLLMRKETLTLSSALAIAKELESVLNGSLFDFHEVNVDIGEYLEPPVQVKRKRGRPRRGEERIKAKPRVTQTLTNSSRLKDEYYYSNDKLYYSDGEDKPQAVDANNLDCSKADDDDDNSTSTTVPIMKEEDSDNNENFVLSPAKRKTLYCHLCTNRHFNNVNKLNRHMRTHTQEKPFACPVCNIKFSQSYHMTRHMRNQHAAGQHVCSTCGETLGSLAELQRHSKTHKAQVLFCPDCNEQFADKDGLCSHVKSHRNDSSSQTEGQRSQQPVPIKRKRGRPRRGEERVKAKPPLTQTLTDSTRCQDENDYSDDKLFHSDGQEKSQAVGEKNLDGSKACDNEKDTSATLLMTNEEDGDNNEDLHSLNKRKDFFCPFCVKHFNKADRYTRHMRTHTKEKPFNCPVCSKTFSQPDHMTRHMRNQHNAGQFVCSICGESLVSLAELHRHNKTHKAQVLFCPDCNEKFTNSQELCSHVKSHRNDSSSQTEGQSVQQGDVTEVKNEEILDARADFCDTDSDAAEQEVQPVTENKNLESRSEKEGGKKTKKTSLKTKTKGHSCPLCVNKHFRGPNKLARHMRTHTQEKPFPCPVCRMTFSQSYHMTRHMRNQHNAGQYFCPTCGEGFGSYVELQSHKKTHKFQALFCPDCHEEFTNSKELCSHVESHKKTDGQSTEQADVVKVKTEAVRDAGATSFDADSNSGESEVQVLSEDKSVDEATSEEDRSKNREKAVSKTKTEGHFCPICVGRCFRGPTKLARHMRTHTKEKPFTCPVCTKTFSQSYHMTRHVRNQHDLGDHVCTKCGKSFSTWLDLKAHRKTHAVEGLTCLACDKQFKGRAALASHLRLHGKVKSNPRSLKCSDCNKEFRRSYHLKRHIMSHRKAANADCYTCPDCQKNFFFPEDLNKHLEIHVKENSGTCPKCNKSFSSAGELEAHLVVHNNTYPCSTCGKKFKVEYALKKHEQSHQNEQYYCSLCHKHFFKVSHYKRHLMVHDRRECRCPHCDSVFLKLTAFKYHLRTHTEERPYQCSCCIETFEEKEDLEKHCLKHRKMKKERPYSCTRCDYAFSTLMELTEHMSLHEGELPETCPICGKTFLNKSKLERHLTIHNGERPHLCSICGNGFTSAASLRLHMNIHTGEKPYQCLQCSKSFGSASGLRLHSRQHMDERPSYECPECGRTYGRMTELKMHQRYHTGDKPHACTCCSKRFISKDKLNVHMRTHTGERPFSCPHCGQTFTQTGDRNRHISKFHPLSENPFSDIHEVKP